jgi:DNA-binding protein H-NS
MTTTSKLQSQFKKVKKSLTSQTTKGKKQVDALRAKAAHAALQWVISHQDRVNQFRASVKGTPVAKALDALLALLKKQGTPKKKAPAKKKPAAKKAVKKAARRK